MQKPTCGKDASRPGHYTLEELTRKASEVDFAAFILGQEDRTESRGDKLISPRDNVVYEAGLFAGYLGIPRVFLLVARGTKIPTDWKGLNYLFYDPPGTLAPSESVRHAGIEIRNQFYEWNKQIVSSLEQQIQGCWWQFVINREEGSVMSLLKVELEHEWKITGTSWTNEGKSIANYRSKAVSLDSNSRKLFYYWDGEHPFDKTIPAFFGIGEIEFDHALNGFITQAKGRYSATQLGKLEETLLKYTIYKRATETEIRIAKGTDTTSTRNLINELLQERKSMMN